ncbi:N-acetyltransferase [Paenibacillus nanensis]|uniref:N-acetyltransferase n=1 Tax=Paenibacillus nanensis TaxID=393251 RepID=A0A3A1UQ29_9BACL|nr:GNAT family N-acetyltransferase [Paenibacillus nanensis]RIX48636.1 N-acetyltransferase [Paenibacillus nanensis]
MAKFTFPSLETERLVLRLLTLKDGPAVFRHFADEEVTRFMDIAPCKDLQEAEEIIRFHLEDSGCRWGLFDKKNGELVGTSGYHCWVTKPERRAEIGFDLSKSYWGLGYMTEALKPILAYGFGPMNLERIEATVEPGNARSRRLLEKLGFQAGGELVEGLIYYDLKP